MNRFVENPRIERELSDEQGLYLLEVRTEGREKGEIAEYQYMRKGRYPNNNASIDTSIYLSYFDGETPVPGGSKVATFRPETGNWEINQQY